MIITVVQVQSRVPGFKEKSIMVIGCKTNDLDAFKVHVVTEIMVDMACNFATVTAYLCSAIRNLDSK